MAGWPTDVDEHPVDRGESDLHSLTLFLTFYYLGHIA
jgi:hypothetical protein